MQAKRSCREGLTTRVQQEQTATPIRKRGDASCQIHSRLMLPTPSTASISAPICFLPPTISPPLPPSPRLIPVHCSFSFFLLFFTPTPSSPINILLSLMTKSRDDQNVCRLDFEQARKPISNICQRILFFTASLNLKCSSLGIDFIASTQNPD